MSSNESTASPSSSLEESTYPQPGHSRRVSSRTSNTYQQDATHQAEQSWLDSEDRTRTPDGIEAGPSSIAPNASSAVQEWPDPLGINPIIQDDAWAEQRRRGNYTSADRKRRLTNSAHNSGRVRTVSGGFHSRIQSSPGSQPEGSSFRDLPQAPRHGPPAHASSRTDPTDPTMRALPPLRHHSTNLQLPTSTAREVLLPTWQPDSEVSGCPICSRQFTFWFRKHHCRKCGRVVCAGCSPHRITIPRQFIVHPPEATNRMSTTAANNPVVVDLTAGTGSSSRSDMAPLWTSPRRTSNPGLGGGEEVRLCNPCVPDPQPSPQATMDLAEFLRHGGTRGEIGNAVERPHPFGSSFGHSDRLTSQNQHSPSDVARELRRQRGRGMIVSVR
jgi:FYVE zinc finger